MINTNKTYTRKRRSTAVSCRLRPATRRRLDEIVKHAALSDELAVALAIDRLHARLFLAPHSTRTGDTEYELASYVAMVTSPDHPPAVDVLSGLRYPIDPETATVWFYARQPRQHANNLLPQHKHLHQRVVERRAAVHDYNQIRAKADLVVTNYADED